MASRVNLAETSLIRSAPFVMTINWTTTSIRKITSPTTKLPPATNEPNVWIIFPAGHCQRYTASEKHIQQRCGQRDHKGSEYGDEAHSHDNITV
jgi:hypothetical protein